MKLAKQGIFLTIQGEGAMIGEPMVFIRLAGCSVACPLCDTDYMFARKATVSEIATEAEKLRPEVKWAWITGGEPADQPDLPLLIIALQEYFSVAVATAGHKIIPRNRADWLSVSPHDPTKWVQKIGSELKIVPGLNGFSLKDFTVSDTRFDHKFAAPCEGKPETVAECREFVLANAGWRMGVQAHKLWALP